MDCRIDSPDPRTDQIDDICCQPDTIGTVMVMTSVMGARHNSGRTEQDRYCCKILFHTLFSFLSVGFCQINGADN